MSKRTESLTGLPNRATLEEDLSQAIKQADGVALGLLDVDHFHELNTELGHEAGDKLLATLAEILREAVPDGSAYRISGDEFAVVLPGVSLEQAFLRMERLRASVQAATGRFNLPGNQEVTVTIGVAQAPRDAKDARSLLKVADSALYVAKESGRNQVALPLIEEMVMKSCYYTAASVRKLKALAERLNKKESHLLREALDDLLRKHDVKEA